MDSFSTPIIFNTDSLTHKKKTLQKEFIFCMNDAQKTQLPAPAVFTTMKASDAHVSSTFLDSRHLFSSNPFATMHARKAPNWSGQNLARMAWRGEASSSLGNLGQIYSRLKLLPGDFIVNEG